MKSKELKRTEAIDRQKVYNSLSRQQKIDKLDKGNFTAKKERQRNGFPPLKEALK